MTTRGSCADQSGIAQARGTSRGLDQSIYSAEAVTFIRALMAREASPKLRNPDNLARVFLGLKWRVLLLPHAIVRRLVERLAPGCCGYHVIRTNRGDELLLRSLKSGTRQVVILGAGNDTRAYRFREELRGARIFELDFPGTQRKKKSFLPVGLPSDHVAFVATDFNSDSWEQDLLRAGYDRNCRTFFSWEGVCYFLPRQSAERVLQFVSENSAPGSELFFDYSLASFVNGDDSTYGASILRRWNEKVGEPHLFGLTEESVTILVESQGMRVVSDLGPIEAEALYLTRSGRNRVRPYGMFRLVHAAVERP